MKTVRKQKIQKLKEKCKSLAVYGKLCRNKINETTGRERYDSWDEKRAIGAKARIHYIAYGLIRGRDYGIIEKHVNDYGDEWAPKVRAKNVAKVLQEYCIEAEHDYWTVEQVEKLLVPNQRSTKV